MFKADKPDPQLVALLDELKSAPARDPRSAARGRAQFLAEAVSARSEQRHSMWTIFQIKEKFAMNLIVSMLVIVGLMFGGSAAVSAAQDDLPNQPLYQLKLMTEEVNLWRLSDPMAQIEMLMKQARTRTDEMAALVAQGIVPSAELTVRSQERIQRALQLAANLDEATQTVTLLQIRAQLQAQEQLMLQLQDGSCAECDPVLQQTRDMLQDQLRKFVTEPAGPQTSPNQNQNQNQAGATQVPPAPQGTPAPEDTCGTCTPALDGTGQQNGTGQESGSGNPSAGTPMPQNNNTTNQNGSGTQQSEDKGNDGGAGPGSGGGGGGQGGQGGKP